MEYKVSALKAQKRNPNRVNVYLDGEFAFGIARIVAAWLKVGDLLDDERVLKLKKQDELEVAYQQALHFLSYRPRSQEEIGRKLKEKGFDQAVVSTVSERMQQNGLLDDARFAQTWVENRSEFRPRGHRLLKMEMRQKGLPEGVIDEALAAAADEDTLAYQAGNRQLRRYAQLEWPEFRVKMGQFLARRGFSFGVISPVVSRLWREKDGVKEAEDPGN